MSPWSRLRGALALRRLANRLALTSGLQLLLVAGALSALTYALGQRSGLQVSESYRQSASMRELSQRLSQKLSFPRTINALNLLESSAKPPTPADFDHLAQVFWRQMQVFPVAYINYGSADGAFIGVERTDRGTLLLNEDSPRLGRGTIGVYAMDRQGRRGRLLETIPGMTSIHQEAWYADTVTAGKATWSAIYAWEDKPEIFSISYNTPLYGPGKQLLGVIGVDMVLSQLSTWLEGVWTHSDGLALIVEPNGQLVASSHPPDTLQGSGRGVRRSRIDQLPDPLARQLSAAFFLRQGNGDLRPQPRQQPPGALERVNVNGRAYLIAASPWGHPEGLNWLLLTALAVDAGTTSSERTALLALGATRAALAVEAWLSTRQILGLLQPLGQLQSAAERLSTTLADDTSGRPLDFHSDLGTGAGEEMAALDRSLGQLVERFNALTHTLRSREESLREVQERERYRDAQALALLKEKLRSSLQAAAVAHEINQPLSVLLLNSQLLLAQSSGDRGREQLQSIRDEAQRVVLTIEKMRTLLRNVQTEHQRLDLRTIAQSALLYARSGSVTAGIAIDSSALEPPSAAAAWIEGDAVQIQIAIVNVLRNAAEVLRDAGSTDPQISIHLERCGPRWRLDVADNGPGFQGDEEEQGPLHTTKARGSGLGLFVVRTTMENHQGSIVLGRSARGGARVSLSFPVA